MAYVETSRSRPKRNGQHELITTTVGVALSATDTGIPTVGSYLDSVSTTVLLPICQTVDIDPTVHAGRVFVTAQWVGLVAHT